MKNTQSQGDKLLLKLSEFFGGYRAEWLGPHLFKLFSKPNYFSAMETRRPCILIGGRGTGKTTVLRGLSYQGRHEIGDQDTSTVEDWPYYGFYYRVDTNKISAFKGLEVPEQDWIKLFAHYINLLMCDQILAFLKWFTEKTDISTQLEPEDLDRVATAFGVSSPVDNEGLSKQIDRLLIEFEAHINNIADREGPLISLQSAPINLLIQSISNFEFMSGKMFFFLIDEYENLLDYQKKVLNTFIKQAGESYTFKIGVKDLGWQERGTLVDNEYLQSPADYVVVDITKEFTDSEFEDFARQVCQDRLNAVFEGVANPPDITELLPGLSAEEEAELLGVGRYLDEIKDELRESDKDGLLSSLTPLQVYQFKYWANSEKTSLLNQFEDFVSNRERWERRLVNYGHAMLFTINRGRPGTRKYYSGWRTYYRLAAGNIRFLMELVEASLSIHIRENESIGQSINPRIQTEAAKRVGRITLTDLEGVSTQGGMLGRLLLSFGRVFGVMAETPEGHTPEVTQFDLNPNLGPSPELKKRVDLLLDTAVMHLALVRWSGTKLPSRSDTRDWDFMIHPIFSAFFNISYRKKRKITVTAEQIMDLIQFPAKGIEGLLESQHRNSEDQPPLPEQLALFDRFYVNPSR